MERIGIVSYNIYGNFTNYGSALQSWAVSQTINKLGRGQYEAVLVDYCPKVHLDKDILDPIKNMWDQDEVSVNACKLSLPAIRENYFKFDKFYNSHFIKTKNNYTYQNISDIEEKDGIRKFVCGSDTIFCTLEFGGFDDGYFANFPCMKGRAISYAASFGDAEFDEISYPDFVEKLKNFRALGIRENKFIPFIKEHVDIPCHKTIDPTLLLDSKDYDEIASERLINEKYILLYARRFNRNMFDYADKLAKRYNCRVIDISLMAETLKDKHEPWYKAGVEEFLSLVKHAEFVVTNSFHGLIFSVQYRRPFIVFSREQADNKIEELLDLFNLKERLVITGDENICSQIDFENVHERILEARKNSIDFFEYSLKKLMK